MTRARRRWITNMDDHSRMCTRKASSVVLAIVVVALAGRANVRAAQWQIDLVDIGGGGKYSTVAADSMGNLHVSYFNEELHQLKYAFWDQSLSKWFVMAI